MKKIANGKGSQYAPIEKIFYMQGKLMEDFEDDFDYHGEFSRYYPTYQSMTGDQLRGYFSWRTKVRRGLIEKTPLSFAFVYIYELINQIGVRSAEEGFYALKNFYSVYKELDSNIECYVKIWLRDYVVYYNLDKSLLKDFTDEEFSAAFTLLNYKSCSTDEVFSALNSLSSYNLETSRFYKRYPDDVKNVTCSVFDALLTYCANNFQRPYYEVLFGKFYASSYNMFNSAVFFHKSRRRDFTYEVNSLCKYTCKYGKWSLERFFCYNGKKEAFGDLLKNIDFLMRQKYNFKSALKAGKTEKILIDIIDITIDEYMKKQMEAARPKFEIDVSKLQDIRKTAMETQKKLLVEEPEESEMATFLVEKTCRNETGLRDDEYMLLKCLLYGGVYDDIVLSKNLPLSVMADAINEYFFDKFGDIVITETEGRLELIADYAEELKGVIKE